MLRKLLVSCRTPPQRLHSMSRQLDTPVGQWKMLLIPVLRKRRLQKSSLKAKLQEAETKISVQKQVTSLADCLLCAHINQLQLLVSRQKKIKPVSRCMLLPRGVAVFCSVSEKTIHNFTHKKNTFHFWVTTNAVPCCGFHVCFHVQASMLQAHYIG